MPNTGIACAPLLRAPNAMPGTHVRRRELFAYARAMRYPELTVCNVRPGTPTWSRYGTRRGGSRSCCYCGRDKAEGAQAKKEGGDEKGGEEEKGKGKEEGTGGGGEEEEEEIPEAVRQFAAKHECTLLRYTHPSNLPSHPWYWRSISLCYAMRGVSISYHPTRGPVLKQRFVLCSHTLTFDYSNFTFDE
eukprot:3339090-Rhodomonas_salina.2